MLFRSPVARSAPVGATDTSPITAATVPQVPAPTDGFCDGWFDYALTVRLLVTLALDSSPTGRQRLTEAELLAAASVEESIGAIGEHWPVELVGERSTVLVDVVGPYLRRAQKATAAMSAAGLTTDDLAELRLAWRYVLAAAGRSPDAGPAA